MLLEQLCCCHLGPYTDLATLPRRSGALAYFVERQVSVKGCVLSQCGGQVHLSAIACAGIELCMPCRGVGGPCRGGPAEAAA